MKKSERIERGINRHLRIEEYKLQEEAMAAFFEVCQSAMTPSQWNKYYIEAKRHAGETFHIFDYMIFALADIQTPISPKLRKSIDTVLDACKIDRSCMDDLRQLNYSSYWKTRYGYKTTQK